MAIVPLLASEGSLCDVRVAPTLASKPGSEAGFYNPKRRVGRDFVVLSVAQWLAAEAACSGEPRPARLLDATCAAGVQGLRVAVESPLLARAISKDEPPELQVVLNDIDENAADLAADNAASLRQAVAVTCRVAQALMHEETFQVSVLDPFGCVQPFLDAAMARAPHGGLVEVCATDVGALYGNRPEITARHYNAHLAQKRPPCYRERGVRILVAAIAQAAGRHDRGVMPVFGVSTEHFCLVSVRVIRRAKAADATAKQVQRVRICRSCGAAGVDANTTQCDCDPVDGAGINAQEEGPMWVGPLYDADAVQAMARIASLEEAKGLVSKETRALLEKVQEEAVINRMFHRRPGVAAGGRTPKLAKVMKELQRRGFKTARTHFCVKSLKTDASVREFDSAVKAVLACENHGVSA